jgi:hypothetical protein
VLLLCDPESRTKVFRVELPAVYYPPSSQSRHSRGRSPLARQRTPYFAKCQISYDIRLHRIWLSATSHQTAHGIPKYSRWPKFMISNFLAPCKQVCVDCLDVALITLQSSRRSPPDPATRICRIASLGSRQGAVSPRPPVILCYSTRRKCSWSPRNLRAARKDCPTNGIQSYHKPNATRCCEWIYGELGSCSASHGRIGRRHTRVDTARMIMHASGPAHMNQHTKPGASLPDSD